MIEQVVAILAHFIINTISKLGYFGVFFLMALESANIPLPSDIIMPFSGFLAFKGQFNLWMVGFWGAAGNLGGSLFSYYLGSLGGRPLIEKYGKYIFLSRRDLERAERWFQKYGEITVFITRLMPVVRTFISLPAGISKMNIFRFSIYSFLGSLPWSLFLAYLGFKMGENWEGLRLYFHRFDVLILVIIILAVIFWIWRHIRNNKINKEFNG
ncbi:DedA family protein [Candidatus Berkelbacteria bacterium]|nr:DedA family protein [Candidatus Berkelbacteria bacterium]